MILISVVLANLLTRALAVALAVFLSFRLLSRWGNVVSAMAAGMLLTIACTHLIPEALEENVQVSTAGFVLLIAFLTFFILEFVLERFAGHSHGIPKIREIPALLGGGHTVCLTPAQCARSASPRAVALLVGVACHNFVDGILVSAAFMVDMTSGWIVAGAIFAHEIPQVVGQLAVLAQTGMSRRCATMLTSIAAMAAVVGGAAGCVLFTALEGIVGYAMLVSAASFIYVVLAVLLPEVSHEDHDAHHHASSAPWREAIGVLLGVALSLMILEPLHEGTHEIVGHDHAQVEMVLPVV